MRTKALVAGALVLMAVGLVACGKKAGEAVDGQTAAVEPNAAPAVAAAATPPKRKAGLWRQTVTVDDRPAMVSKICTDEAFEQKASVFAANAMPGACSESSISPAVGGWKFHSVCSMGSGGTTVSDGAVTGDMGSRYEVKSTTTTTGAAAPQMNRTAKMSVVAEREGDCPAGWAGGDMELPGGVRIKGGSVTRAGPPAAPK